MSGIQISRSPDLARLEADGLRLRVVQGAADHLLVEGIPAVNSKREVVKGTLYSTLEINQHGTTNSPVSSHQCWWIGEMPCDSSGRAMMEMVSNPSPESKGDGITTTVGFSRKRANKTPYDDYHEKIWAYIRMIWHEAQVIDPKCDPRLEKPVAAVVEAQARVFHYPDMGLCTFSSGRGEFLCSSRSICATNWPAVPEPVPILSARDVSRQSMSAGYHPSCG